MVENGKFFFGAHCVFSVGLALRIDGFLEKHKWQKKKKKKKGSQVREVYVVFFGSYLIIRLKTGV